MDPQCLERQIQLFQTDTNIDIVYTALKVIDETGQLLTQIGGREEKSEDFFPLMLFRNQIPGPGTIMAKKNVFCGLGYPEDRKHGEDYALMLRLAEAKYRFFYLDEPLYMYRRHSNNLSNQLNIQQQSAAQIVCQYPLATLEAAVAASSFSSEEKTLLLAKILWNQNHIETAIEKFSSLTSQEAYFYLGNYWLQKHDPQRASLFFDQGLLDHLSPNPAIFNNQGVALSRLGRIEEAQAFFVKALAISPSYLDAKHNLGMLRIHPDQLAVTSRFLRIPPLPYI